MKNSQRKKSLVNGSVLTVDNINSYFPDGVVVVSGGQIENIGPADEVRPEGDLIDMSGMLIIPGLVNTHTHTHSTLFRNAADDLKLMDWLKKVIWPAEKRLTEELSFWGTSLSCLEMLRNGVTTYADQYYFAKTTAKAATQSGLRAFIAPTVFTGSSPESKNTFQKAADFIEEYRDRSDHTRVYPCIGPHAPYSVGNELWKQVVEIAKRENLIVHTHISETLDENVQIREKTGFSPTEYLHSLGVFDCRVLAAHCIHLSDSDIALFVQNDISASYNPVSNMKLASGIMPFRKLREKGVRLSMGTDGAQSNNTLDLFRDSRVGVLLQKLVNDDATFINAEEAVRLLTIDGARALDVDHQIGSLEAGKEADLIAIDMRKPHLQPYHRSSIKNAYASLAYTVCGHDVVSSMVGGKWLMRDSEVLTMDSDIITDEARKASEYILTAANLL